MQCKDILDEDFLAAVDQVSRARGGGWAMYWEVGCVLGGHPEHVDQPAPHADDPAAPCLPDRLVLAKARKLIKKGYLGGCGCGCRGDFEVRAWPPGYDPRLPRGHVFVAPIGQPAPVSLDPAGEPPAGWTRLGCTSDSGLEVERDSPQVERERYMRRWEQFKRVWAVQTRTVSQGSARAWGDHAPMRISPASIVIDVSAEDMEQFRRRLAESLVAHQQAARVLSERAGEVVRALRPAIEQVRQVAERVQGREPAPADPRERALWLRRNRNTGPKGRARAPKRIDPRRGR